MAGPPREHRPTFGWLSRTPDPDRPLDARYVQERWVRLYRPGPWRALGVTALGLLLVLLTIAVTLAVTSATGWALRLIVLLVGLALLAAAFAAVGRVLTTAVYVHDHGVRVAGLRRLTTLGWDDVVDVRRLRSPARPLGLLPRRDAETVVLVRRGGDDVLTPMTSVSSDFLGRPEAFDMAALALERWWHDSR